MGGWIDIKAGLPKVGSQKHPDMAWLVFDGEKISLEKTHPSYWNHKDSRGEEYDGTVVTHWMSLPDKPHA